MQIKTAFVVLAALASASAIGCGSTSSTGANTGTARASLHRAKGCGDLLADLKADAIYKLNKGINQQLQGIQACQKKYPDTQCASYGGYYGSRGQGFGGEENAATDAASPSAPSAGGASGSKSSDSASSFSETNTQVKGVDEADIVKNDGKNLFVLHGNTFKVLNAWPANDLKEMASITVEGQPSEMFVADGKVVIYSTVNGASIFTAANVTPKQQYSDYGYGYADSSGGASRDHGLPGQPGQAYIPLTKITVMALNGTTPTVTREVYFEGSYLDSRRVGTNVRTVLQGHQYGPVLKYGIQELYPQPQGQGDFAPGEDVPGGSPTKPSDPTTPTTNPYPKTGTEMIAALEKLRAANIATVNASQLPEWLPYTFVKNGASVNAQTVACQDFYVPTTGSTESGLTEVASLDLADPAATPQETAILGRVDTVYGNADTLYLAARAWVEPPFSWQDQNEGSSDSGEGSAPPSTGVSPPPSSGNVPEPDPAPRPTPGGLPSAKLAGSKVGSNVRPLANPSQPTGPVVAWATNRTHIHKFEFKVEPKFPNYVASGTIDGNVKNQFSLDEKDNNLRVATTENRAYVTTDGKYVQADFQAPTNGAPPPVRPNSVNHVFVLSQHGPWLDETGKVGELAPNEQIYSVRFVGSRGYVVTFRQVDPLFVLDLSAPSNPSLLAALKIPGFSEYMHPIDENHLLTIGRDATATGQQRGLQLQIFDVTDGANPILQHKFTYTGQEYGSSEAEHDHKAFTFFAEKNLLAFPYYSYGNGSSSGMRSSLELFKVDLGAGFSKLGSIDHTALIQTSPKGYCGGYYGPSVRRGVFLENFVYSISYGGVVVKDSNNLGAAGKELALPAPLTNDGYGPTCGGGGPGGGDDF